MRLYAALFAIGLAVYGVVSWERVTKQSAAPHFVYQADAWLNGSLAIRPPTKGDDWAKVERVRLDDGTEHEGRRMRTRPVFRTLDGAEFPLMRVKQSVETTHYVSFPPFPSVLMLPATVIAGRDDANDVIVTLIFAALILPLALLLLRRLADAKLSQRTLREDLWLVGLLAFGSVVFFSAVQGKVWYTAHIIGVVLALVYAWASIEAKRPIIAGLALGAAALTRTPMAFMFPLFLFEAWRMTADVADRRRALIKPLVRFALPVIAFALVGAAFNYARFGSLTEFGHSYLDVRQQSQIETHGLASLKYLSRNLTVALTLLPEPLPRTPFFQISGHGLAMWFTTPLLLTLLWPRERTPLHRALYVTTLLVALPSLLYQNSGWFQFGYRFSLDYMVFLVMLLALGGRPLTRLAKAAIIFGVVVNLFGAMTFDRYWRYYRGGQGAYESVVAH